MALNQDTTATLSDCKLETTLWDLYGGRIGSIEANQDNAKKKKKASVKPKHGGKTFNTAEGKFEM